ncbi:serine hydrolase [Sphingomonas cavernae]|nr:serine hydrolase [Sphingomonas cavernae]
MPTEAPAALQSAIRSLGASFDGSVGIAVRDVHTGWVVDYNGRQPMPQQSVSKLWVAATLLEGVDQGRISLSEMVMIRPSDLTLFHQPIRQLVGKNGYQESVSGLLARAMTQSDNTANDSLLRRAGGPAAVRSFLTSHGITDIRFGPGERLLQSGTAGLTWKQEYSVGHAFYTARANLPMNVRQNALDRYLADPPDGATAIGMVDALAKLKRGELLSPRSTDYLITTMRASRTGPKRLRGGISDGWLFGHKTGTGQQLGGTSTGYNDVGLLTAPDGRTYAVAVMIGSTRRSIPERMSLMQAVTRAVISSHWSRPAQTD